MRPGVFVLCTLLLVYGGAALSAQPRSDSLWNVWQDGSITDTLRLNALHDLIFEEYLHSHADSALILAQLHFDLANSNGLQLPMAKSLRLQGLVHNEKGDYQRAYSHFIRSKELFAGIGSRGQVAQCLVDLGNLQQDKLQYDSSYYYFNEAISVYQQLSDRSGIAKTMQQKGISAHGSADYPEAMEFEFKALRIFEKLNDKAAIAGSYINLADILYYQENYEESISYGRKALEFLERIDDKERVADAYREIGESYLILGEYDSALVNIDKALSIKIELGGSRIRIGSVYNSRGNVYKYLEDYPKALVNYDSAYTMVEEVGFELGVMNIKANVGHVYVLMGEYEKALPYTLGAIEMMEASDNKVNLWENYMHAANAYEGLGNYKNALAYYRSYASVRDSLFTEERDHRLSELRTEYETEKKEEEIVALEKEATLMEQAEERDRYIRILLIALAVLLVLLAVGLWNRLTFTRKSKAIIQKAKDRSEELLLNILPAEVAEELKENGKAESRRLDNVTVLFTDFKGFTAMAEKLSAKDLVRDLNICFSEFDRIMEKFGIEKIKTIGDAYMAAGGLPLPDERHAQHVIMAAFEMRDFVEAGKARKVEAGLPYFEIRIGIHTGPVVAGIVGVKKFQYDIWGDTVNTASRMESSGEVGQVNISEATYELVKDNSEFSFTSRGKVEAKGKGEMEMYFVEQV